jgi:inner membrane protein
MLPDADVIGFSLGVRYEDEWGHRGATHSIAFSLALGAAIGLVAPLSRLPALRTGTVASLVLASHALLDTLTNGGLGCALLWPFDLTRYFAPWNPIPVSPIGLYVFSAYGLTVVAVELVLFAPLFWLAWPPGQATSRGPERRRRAARALLAGLWLIAVWLLTSSDAARDRVVRLAFRDGTEFTQGFSEDALDLVESGDTEQEVRARLGAPFFEFVAYPDGPEVCVVVGFEEDIVLWTRPADVCRRRGIEPGLSHTAVLEALGEPVETCWVYSRNPGGGFYRARGVCFSNARVTAVVRRWMRE